jgi:hypothetical protein
MRKLLCTLMLATLGTAAAKADDLTITLDHTTQTAGPGATVEFFGTITNDTNTTIYLNSDDLDFSSPGFTEVDDFFSTVPISLAPIGVGDSSGDIELFDIAVNNPFSSASGYYSGAYTLFGGNDGGADTAQDNLGHASFSVGVTPEPSSILLLLTGMAALAAPLLRRAPLRSTHETTSRITG